MPVEAVLLGYIQLHRTNFPGPSTPEGHGIDSYYYFCQIRGVLHVEPQPTTYYVRMTDKKYNFVLSLVNEVIHLLLDRKQYLECLVRDWTIIIPRLPGPAM